MQNKWPIKPLGEHIIELKESHENSELKGAIVLSVTNDRGFVISENKTSEDLSNYKIISEDNFAYNPYRINVGSIALAGKNQTGIVSPAYVVFKTSQDLSPDYLLRFLKSDIGIYKIKNFGRGSVRSALRFEDLQKVEIPLPTMREQETTISKIRTIEDVDKKSREQKLSIEKLVIRLANSVKHKIFSGFEWVNIPNDAVELLVRGKSPIYEENSEVICLNQQCNRWNKIELENAKKVSKKWFQSLDKNMLTRRGDIIINSTGNGTVGRASLVDDKTENLIYDSHILLLRLKREIISPEFFVEFFNSDDGQVQVLKNISAKTTKQTELGINNLLKTKLPVPPIKEQSQTLSYLQRICSIIDEIIKELSRSKTLQASLLPSILFAVFNNQSVSEVNLVAQLTRQDWFNLKLGIGAVLEKLARTPYERGEMVIAKFMYLLKEVYGIPFTLTFARHQFGPYDPNIKKAIVTSAFNKDRYFTVKGSGVKQVYSLGSNANGLLKYNAHILRDARSALADLMPHLARAKSSNIELLATVCKVVQDIKTTDLDGVENDLKQWKPQKFSREQVSKALEFIKLKKWDVKLTTKN